MTTDPWWISLIKAFVIVNLVMLTFAYLTWLERKGLGRLQNRYGPNRAGPFGLLQPFADLIKLVRKEAFAPSSAIDVPYILAPIVSMFTALAAFSVIPWGSGWRIYHWNVTGEVVNVPLEPSIFCVFSIVKAGSAATVTTTVLEVWVAAEPWPSGGVAVTVALFS